MPAPATPGALVTALVTAFKTALQSGATPQSIEAKLAAYVGGHEALADLAPPTAEVVTAAAAAAPSAVLTACLGLCYGERYGLVPSGPTAAFTQAVAADPALQSAAQAQLASLQALAQKVGNLRKRDVISATHLEILTQALG